MIIVHAAAACCYPVIIHDALSSAQLMGCMLQTCSFGVTTVKSAYVNVFDGVVTHDRPMFALALRKLSPSWPSLSYWFSLPLVGV